MKSEDTRAIFTAIFAGSVVLANILAAKLTWVELPGIGGVAVLAGFVAFGVAYLASDLLVEYHGKGYAATVINGTVLTLVLAYALIFLAIWMPTAPFYEGQEAFVTTLGDSTSIILASVVALALAQHLDVRLFATSKTAPVVTTGGSETADQPPSAKAQTRSFLLRSASPSSPHSASAATLRGGGRLCPSSQDSTL